MAKVLVVYATTEGQTRKIAETIGGWLHVQGHEAVVVDASREDHGNDPARFDAVIAAGSLHMEKHQDSLLRYVKTHVTALNTMPTMFLSVSLSAIIDDPEHRADVKKCIDAFLASTGWTPTQTEAVAGALKYSQYDFFKKSMLRMIAKKNGYDTDPNKDYEYTDWARLSESVQFFMSRV